jgi:hypothetical protein
MVAAMSSVRLAPLALAALLALPALARADSTHDCHIGAYRLAGGKVVDIAPGEGDALRWRGFDGSTGEIKQGAGGVWTSTLGWTGRPDGKTVTLSACDKGEMTFAGAPARRIPFDVTETMFHAGDVDLAGRLVMPKGSGPVPIVVLIHGSEDSSARDLYALQRLLPSQGVGVFVYDKRGTGGSGGKYTQDFSRLADDAVLALKEARRLAGPRAGRMGFQGGSQGGWVAPLAANRSNADFVIVSFGLAVSPLEEDQQEVELEMKLKGHSPADIAKALEVARAGDAVMASGFTQGIAAYDAIRIRYRNEPWYKDLRGNLTRYILPWYGQELHDKGQAFIFGTPWNYDSMPVLRQAKAPELWILGEADLDAPSAETARKITALGQAGRPFTLAMYPGAEHGMTEFELDKTGERLSTRFAPGYFQMMADFIRDGRIGDHYGSARITRPRTGR